MHAFPRFRWDNPDFSKQSRCVNGMWQPALMKLRSWEDRIKGLKRVVTSLMDDHNALPDRKSNLRFPWLLRNKILRCQLHCFRYLHRSDQQTWIYFNFLFLNIFIQSVSWILAHISAKTRTRTRSWVLAWTLTYSHAARGVILSSSLNFLTNLGKLA